MGRIQKYPKIHDSNGEESSGSGTDSTQGTRPRHLWEDIREAPEQLAWGLAFPETTKPVPEVPVVTREHLTQHKKIQEVLPSRRDEVHFL